MDQKETDIEILRRIQLKGFGMCFRCLHECTVSFVQDRLVFLIGFGGSDRFQETALGCSGC